MLNSLKDVTALKAAPHRFRSATHEELKAGATTDIYFINTRDVLASVGKLDTPVTAEIFSRSIGMFAGLDEVMELLRDAPVKVEAGSVADLTLIDPAKEIDVTEGYFVGKSKNSAFLGCQRAFHGNGTGPCADIIDQRVRRRRKPGHGNGAHL